MQYSYLKYYSAGSNKAFTEAVHSYLRDNAGFTEKNIKNLNLETFNALMQVDFNAVTEAISLNLIGNLKSRAGDIQRLNSELRIDGEALVLIYQSLKQVENGNENALNEIQLFVSEYLLRNSESVLESVKKIRGPGLWRKLTYYLHTNSRYYQAFGDAKASDEVLAALKAFKKITIYEQKDQRIQQYLEKNIHIIEPHEVVSFLQFTTTAKVKDYILKLYAIKNSRKLTATQAAYLSSKYGTWDGKDNFLKEYVKLAHQRLSSNDFALLIRTANYNQTEKEISEYMVKN